MRVIHALPVCLLLVACHDRVVGGLGEAEANRLVSALEEQGVPAEKRSERSGRDITWAVEVQPGDGPRAREVISHLSVPGAPEPGFEGILAEESIVPSVSRERLKESVARGNEIASTLETLDGVVDASVIIARPDPPAWSGAEEDPPEGTASVLLKVRGDLETSESDVRRLVAGAVTGVEPDGVEVVVSRVEIPEARQEAPWVRLGPFVVSPPSRLPLLIILTTMAALNLVLGALVVVGALRRRKPDPPPG